MENLILITMLFLLSWSPLKNENDIQIIGTIDNKVNDEINLSIKGNIVKGNFFTTETDEKTELKGLKTDNSQDQSSKLKIEYLNWVKQINKTEGYCTNEDCEKSGGFNDLCGYLTIVTEFPKEVIYGDINNDGIEDAFIYAKMSPCMMGTWFANVVMAGHLVVFVSNKDSEYSIFSKPLVLSDIIDFGRVKKINNNIIYAEGLGLDGQGAHSLGYKWNCRFKFDDNTFKLISKSNKIEYKE